MTHTTSTLLLSTLFTASLLASTTALARDLGPDEAIRLREAGTIQALDKLNQQALEQHPGGKIHETELEERTGRYVYQLEVIDAQGLEWDIEFDASTGALLHNHQDK